MFSLDGNDAFMHYFTLAHECHRIQTHESLVKTDTNYITPLLFKSPGLKITKV